MAEKTEPVDPGDTRHTMDANDETAGRSQTQPPSPLTGRAARHERRIPVRALIDAYRNDYGIDVSAYLPEVDFLEAYRCEETDLVFFGGDLSGPPAFYAELYSGDDESWAYQDEKWEFATARRLLTGADSVLDIGCGGGAFLGTLEGSVSSRSGLETSPFGREQARKRGLEVHDQTITDHAAEHSGRYEAVTAFQVLERVDDPRAFVGACVDALAPGGRLVLSVPNNDAFLRHCALLPLNLPPHHVTLWHRRTLEALPALFDLELDWVETEPLQADITGWFQAVVEERYLPASRAVRWLYYRLGGDAAVRRAIEENRENIAGHTILAAYRKRSAPA